MLRLRRATCRPFVQRGQRRSIMSYQTSSSPKPLVLAPKEKPQKGTVIFLHGLGDTGYGWEDAMSWIQQELKSVKFILPHAPKRPVTLNGGFVMPAWYDIIGLSERSRVDLEGLEQSRKIVEDIISSEIEAGIPSEKIILGGFSQGGALSLFAGFQSNNPLGGILALSCYLPAHENFAQLLSDANRNTKLLMCHGTADDVVQYQWGKASFEKLKEMGIKGELKTYPGMGHSACLDELKDMTEFIRTCLEAPKL